VLAKDWKGGKRKGGDKEVEQFWWFNCPRRDVKKIIKKNQNFMF
jgi:hypothetical protein